MAKTTAVFISILLAACTPERPPVAQPTGDATLTSEYRQLTAKLAELNTATKAALARGARDEAARLIGEGEKIAAQLLAPSRPTLDAMIAAGDRDQLYGDMLFANRHYGYARQMYAKNLARWRSWSPATPDTERRRAEAQRQIEACDREIARQ